MKKRQWTYFRRLSPAKVSFLPISFVTTCFNVSNNVDHVKYLKANSLFDLALFCQFLLVFRLKMHEEDNRVIHLPSHNWPRWCHTLLNTCLRKLMNKDKDIFSFLDVTVFFLNKNTAVTYCTVNAGCMCNMFS